MQPDVAKAGIVIACLMLVGGVPLLIFGTPGTGAYTVTIFTVLIGVVFIVAIGIVVRIGRR